MTTVRTPAVAGLFYSADARELRAALEAYLQAVRSSGPPPKAMIVPHAGYIYSGPIAASAYARLAQARDIIKRVILLGPAHRFRFRGLAASRDDAFSTPLGVIPVDTKLVQRILSLPQVHLSDEAHAGEHSLEVHLPFLQVTLNDFSLVPLAVGDATPAEIGEVLDLLWGGTETLIVVSSDLSHYYDYETARRMDRATTRAIEALAPQSIQEEGACGRVPVRGLLVAARKHGLKAQMVDLRNSGDTAGSRDEVVGYGAYVFL